MNGISISKITDRNELIGHSCGEEAIDRMIASAFYSHLYRQQDTYCIRFQGEVVGSYALSVRAIDFSACDEEIAEYFENNLFFGVLYIPYLAVDTDMQGKGIGTAVLKHIIHFAMEKASEIPIRCVLFDALRRRVKFYQDRGCIVLSKDEFNSDSETVRMFFDLITEEERNKIYRIAANN